MVDANQQKSTAAVNLPMLIDLVAMHLLWCDRLG